MADSNDSQSLASRLKAVAAPSEFPPADVATPNVEESAAPTTQSDLTTRLKAVAAPIEETPKEEVSPEQIKSAALGVGGQFAVPYLSKSNPENLSPEEKQAIVGLDGKSLSELLKSNKGIKLSDVSTKDLVPMYRRLQDYETNNPESDTHPLVKVAKLLSSQVAEGIHGLKTVGTDIQAALGPISPIFGVSSTPTGAFDTASAGIFSPDESYDSRYQKWALQAYNARQNGQPIPEKPAPPKEGEKSVYYQSPEAEKSQEEYQKQYADWAKSAGVLGYLTGKGMPKPPETKEPTEAEKIKEVGLDAYTVADKTVGAVKDLYQTVSKINEGGTKLTDDIGIKDIAVDPETGLLSIKYKTPTEKLINRIARDEIDADRERVRSKSPSNIGQVLYYMGEQPTDSGQQSYAQLFRPIIASYLVPSVRQRMLDNPNLTEGEATQQWLQDSDKWGSSTLQKAAQAMPKPKEDVGTAAEFLFPQYTTSFGLAAETLGGLATLTKEAARLSEVEELLPQARAMTDTAHTAREGGVFYVDSNGNVTAAPKTSSGPRTKEQVREDWNNAEQLHADMERKTDIDNFLRLGSQTIRLGPWNIPKPHVIAGSAADSVNNAADFIKKAATTGALATAIPATTGAIGAYQNRNEGLLGMGAGFLKGLEYGAAGELAGYGALKTAGKTLGLLSDLGKVKSGLQGTGGNVFQIAGNLPTSTDLTKEIFGGKIGKITAPTANWLANNLVNWTYEGVQAGALAGAMGVLDSTPYQDLPEQAATGAAMMLMPHILTSAIHETPASREKRIAEENNSINQVKAQASPDSLRTASEFSDYREVVNNQKQISADKNQKLREVIADPKSKPKDIEEAQKEAKEADQRLTQIMSANSETRLEYGRQNDLLWAKIHRGLNGPIRAGQGNIGIEILTKDQILQKLVDANKELASTPQGLAKLEMIAGQDGMVINSAGGVELRVGTDLAEALKKDPIMFDPSKTTAIINADNARRRAGIYGTTIYDALSHEGGHLYGRTKEFQEANSELLNNLFSTNIYHDDGTVASENLGAVSNAQLKDMIWNNYLRGRTDEQKKAWLESQGMWDRANDRFIDKEVIPYAREEYIAEMAGNALHSMVNSGGETAVMKWARTSNSNNMLARAVQAVLGVGGPDPTKPSPVMGIEFTPEIRAATEKAIQAVNDYNGHIAPVIDAEPVVEITQKELKKNKGLLKKYGVNSGMFQTQVYATIRDARGNVVSKVPISNEAAAEGSWKVDPATGKPVQTKGYGQIPDEATNVQIPQGGSLDVQREVAMQPDGESPILLSDSQQKKNQKARRDLILNALGITGEIPEEGITWRGTFTPEQVQNIKNLPENVVPKTIKDVILSMNETLATGEGQRWLTEYSPTSGKKGKRKSLMMKQYDVVPIGMHFTKDGNFNVTVISATRLFNKIHAWGAEFPHILDMWGGSKSEFFNDFVTKYLANWKQGKEGWEGLDPDEKTAKLKRDIFNNFLNLKDKDTEFKNQNRFYLKGKQADLDRTIMSMRADHVSSLQRSSAQPIPVDYYKAKINAMPESGLPYQERPEEPAPAPREEERKPSAIDLGITAAHSREAKPFGAQYVPQENKPSLYDAYGWKVDTKGFFGKNTRSVLDELSKNEKIEETWRNLAKTLSEFPSEVLDSEKVYPVTRDVAFKGELGRAFRASGSFNSKAGVYLPQKGSSPQTIIHEIAGHTMTADILHKWVPTRGVTYGVAYDAALTRAENNPDTPEQVVRLIKLYRSALEQEGLTEQYLGGTIQKEIPAKESQEHEFIFWKLSNGDSQIEIYEKPSLKILTKALDKANIEYEVKLKGWNRNESGGVTYYSTPRVIIKDVNGAENFIKSKTDHEVLRDGRINFFLNKGPKNSKTRKVAVKGMAAEDPDKTTKKGGLYGYGNLHEFVAQTWSDKAFQDRLKKLKGDGKQSMWQTFTNIVNKLFGFGSDSLAASVIDATHSLAELRDKELKKYKEEIEQAKKRPPSVGEVDLAEKSALDTQYEAFDYFRRKLKPESEEEYVDALKEAITLKKDGKVYIASRKPLADAMIKRGWTGTDSSGKPYSPVTAEGISFMPSREEEPERIIEATYTNPRTGEVSRGATHTIANPNAPQEATDRESPAYGFATDKGRIVDRKEAYNIAQAAGQLKAPATEEQKFHAARGVLHSGMYEPKGISFMPSKLDEAHAAAIESGDTEEAQRLVDEAARKAGYTIGPVLHGTGKEFTVFDKEKRGASNTAASRKAFWFTTDEATATNFSRLRNTVSQSRIIKAYLKGKFATSDFSNIPDWNTKESHAKRNEVVQRAIREGKDGVHFINMADLGPRSDIYAVFEPNQIKSADPATYDDQGNLIPLSQRFDTSKQDIRFMPSNVKIDEDPEAVGYSHGQTDLVLRAKKAGKTIGYVSLAKYGDNLTIQNIEVAESDRRQGIATALVANAQKFADSKNLNFEWSGTTQEGEALRKSIGSKSTDPEITEDGHVMPKTMDKPFAFTPKIAMNFMPATPQVDLENFLDRPIIALAADRMGIGQAYVGPTGAKQPLSMPSQGGAGFSTLYRDEEHNPIWAFSKEQPALNFLKRINDVAEQYGVDSVLVAPTLLAPDNHLKNQTGQLGYVEAMEAAMKAKMIKPSALNAQINEIIKRIAESESPKAKQATKRLEGISTFAEFADAVRKQSFNFADAEWIMKKAAQKKLPITAKELDQMGLLPSNIARDLAHEGFYELPNFSVVSLFEVPKGQKPEKGMYHNAYPYIVRGKSIGYLKNIINLAQATKDPKVFNKGQIQSQPLMTVMPIIDQVLAKKALDTLKAYTPTSN
jgi:hypothetical protein